MNIEYTVIYPSCLTASKQLSFYHKIVASRNNAEILENIFSGWNNGSQMEFSFFLAQNVRSMSVGDVVAIYKPTLIGAQWFICEANGWLAVNATQAQSWLDFPRKYSCDFWELTQWKRKHFAQAHSHIKL
jgi:hypothetical protein